MCNTDNVSALIQTQMKKMEIKTTFFNLKTFLLEKEFGKPVFLIKFDYLLKHGYKNNLP